MFRNFGVRYCLETQVFLPIFQNKSRRSVICSLFLKKKRKNKYLTQSLFLLNQFYLVSNRWVKKGSSVELFCLVITAGYRQPVPVETLSRKYSGAKSFFPVFGYSSLDSPPTLLAFTVL